MTDLIVRFFELLIGSMLIVATLITSSYFVNDIILLLPLLALPIIFSGMFNWHPAEKLSSLSVKLGSSVKQMVSKKMQVSSI
ncbi:hypothetical protein [Kaarinaea lacus]